jgi:hypothetical protein
MATYQITTSRSDMTEASVVTRHRVDAARQVYATLVWGVMRWASLLDRPIAHRLVNKARCAAPGRATEFAPFTVSFERVA